MFNGSADSIETTRTASIQDLHLLKRVNPATVVKYGDISRHVRQNCDATSCVLTNQVIVDLDRCIPGSTAMQLYLQACIWTHALYRNEQFSPLPAVAKPVGRSDDLAAIETICCLAYLVLKIIYV